MEKNSPSPIKSALIYGLIIAAISISYSLILYSFSQMTNKILGIFNLVILIGGIIWAIKNFRDKKSEGFISLGKGFSVGLYTGIICATLGAVYTFVFFKYFDPDLLLKMLADAEEELVKKYPNMDEAQLETSMVWTRKFMSPLWMSAWGGVMNIFIAAVISVITAAILKKEENPMQSTM